MDPESPQKEVVLFTNGRNAGNHPMNTDDTDNFDLSEDALRQALDRLGRSRSPAANPAPRKPAERPQAATQGNAQHHSHAFDHAQRRRRFVQDGEVVVERHALTRPARAVSAQSPHEDQHAELERAQEALRRELRRREDAERLLTEANTTIRSLETRAGHADMRLDEMRKLADRANEDLLALRAHVRTIELERDGLLDAKQTLEVQVARLAEAELVTAEVASPVRARKVAAPRRAAAVRAPDVTEDEPEPVKWWIRKKA